MNIENEIRNALGNVIALINSPSHEALNAMSDFEQRVYMNFQFVYRNAVDNIDMGSPMSDKAKRRELILKRAKVIIYSHVAEEEYGVRWAVMVLINDMI